MNKNLLWILILIVFLTVGLVTVTANNGPGDPDADGIKNQQENTIWNTNQNDWDTDNDGWSDGMEIAAGRDPLDGYGGDTVDPDLDGFSDAVEDFYGTNINLWDTDNDGYGDAVEIVYGTNPTFNECSGCGGTDADGDRLSDYVEINMLGTSTTDHDTDQDGYGDEVEYAARTNPLDNEDHPNP